MDAVHQDLAGHPRLGPYLDPAIRQFLTEPATANAARALAASSGARSRLDFTAALRTAVALHQAGVPVLPGTDANGSPDSQNPILRAHAGHGIALLHELALLVQAGLTPAEALAIATSAPARCFSLADRGQIVPGLRADLLLVKGDPTTDITATRNITGIWRHGTRLDREAETESRHRAYGNLFWSRLHAVDFLSETEVTPQGVWNVMPMEARRPTNALPERGCSAASD